MYVCGFAVVVSSFFNSWLVVVWFMRPLTLNIFSSMLGSSVRVKTGICSFFSVLGFVVRTLCIDLSCLDLGLYGEYGYGKTCF
jgi:hypothetical protein